MKIVAIALLENGWTRARDGLLTFPVRRGVNLWAGSDDQTLFLECEGESYELPNVKTLEEIKVVLHLLGEWECAL